MGDVDPKKAAFAKIGAAPHMPHMSTKRQRRIFLNPDTEGHFLKPGMGSLFFYRVGRGDLRGEAGLGYSER